MFWISSLTRIFNTFIYFFYFWNYVLLCKRLSRTIFFYETNERDWLHSTSSRFSRPYCLRPTVYHLVVFFNKEQLPANEQIVPEDSEKISSHIFLSKLSLYFSKYDVFTIFTVHTYYFKILIYKIFLLNWKARMTSGETENWFSIFIFRLLDDGIGQLNCLTIYITML